MKIAETPWDDVEEETKRQERMKFLREEIKRLEKKKERILEPNLDPELELKRKRGIRKEEISRIA